MNLLKCSSTNEDTPLTPFPGLLLVCSTGKQKTLQLIYPGVRAWQIAKVDWSFQACHITSLFH